MFLSPFRQSDNPLRLHQTEFQKLISAPETYSVKVFSELDKGDSIYPDNCYTILEINYIIHTFSSCFAFFGESGT